jgi:predicted Holliday junction resolvase-like endonuclease
MDLILNLMALLLVVVLIFFWRYLKLKEEVETRALKLFDEWRTKVKTGKKGHIK